MNRVFADTSFYIAISNASDERHLQASGIAGTLRGEIVTTDFVVVELGNWLSRSGDRDVFLRLMDELSADPLTRIVSATRELLDRGIDFYARRMDKDWSLTDCVSFVVMADERVTEALTADRHFEQAGFVALLN